MMVLAAIHIPVTAYLTKRDFLGTIGFLALWLLASAVVVGILLFLFRPLLVRFAG